MEYGGNVSKAIRDAGYSPETAKTPSKLTNTRGLCHYMTSIPFGHFGSLRFQTSSKAFRALVDLPKLVKPKACPLMRSRITKYILSLRSESTKCSRPRLAVRRSSSQRSASRSSPQVPLGTC